jgi:hypothetical protein
VISIFRDYEAVISCSYQNRPFFGKQERKHTQLDVPLQSPLRNNHTERMSENILSAESPTASGALTLSGKIEIRVDMIKDEGVTQNLSGSSESEDQQKI